MALAIARQIPHPPAAPTQEDAARWKHSGLRIRMMVGRWEDDLDQALAMHIDPSRQAAWGTPDLSSNIFRSVTKQLSVLYDRAPVVDHIAGPDEGLGLIKAVDASGLWPLMPRFGANVIGCREFYMAVSCTAEGELVYRPVAPNRIVALADSERPDRPVFIRELRLRHHPETQDHLWTWHEIDIRDPSNPIERILSTDHTGGAKQDLTALYFGADRSGEAFPYVDSSGAPFIPGVLYHAERTGYIWDAYEGSEVVFGSLSCAVFYSMFGHCLLDSSWPQRYAIGALPMGLGLEGGSNSSRRAISTDPASILLFAAEGDLQPQLGQFAPGADVAKMLESIASYEHRVAQFAGVSPADLQRLGGTARSGAAISISNAGKREAQRKFEPAFRAGDLELLSVSARLLNIQTGAGVPESGYTIRYQAIPLSAQERDGIRKDLIEKIQAGIMSKVDAYLELHTGMSRAQAIRELQRIRLEESIAPTPAAPGAGGDAGAVVITTGAEPTIDDEGTITDPGDPVTVLNGAQVTAAQGIVEAVASQRLPRDTGLNMLIEFFGIPQAAALRIMGTVGLGFVPAAID